MSNIFHLAKRELNSLFLMPSAYILMFVFLLIQGYTFWILVSALNNPSVQVDQTILQLFFGGTFFFWFSVILIASVVTMRLISEEKKNGTFELLVTAPVTNNQILFGKYIASLIFYILLWLPTALFLGLLGYFVSLDLYPVIIGYLGVFLLGAMFHAIGLFASSITSNQIVSAILCFGISVFIFSLSFTEFFLPGLSEAFDFSYFNLLEAMDDFGRGIIDLRTLVYCGSITVLFLFLTNKSLRLRQ